MKVKYIVGVVGGIAIAGGIGWFVIATMQKQNAEVNKDTKPPASTVKTYSAVEVARHNSPDDCWTIIRGSVYDLTSYVARHPGGVEIERACGIDATSLFENRTTESGEAVGSGQPHSKAAREQLEQLKLGILN